MHGFNINPSIEMKSAILLLYTDGIGPTIANWSVTDVNEQYVNNELHLAINLEVSAKITYACVSEIGHLHFC